MLVICSFQGCLDSHTPCSCLFRPVARHSFSCGRKLLLSNRRRHRLSAIALRPFRPSFAVKFEVHPLKDSAQELPEATTLNRFRHSLSCFLQGSPSRIPPGLPASRRPRSCSESHSACIYQSRALNSQVWKKAGTSDRSVDRWMKGGIGGCCLPLTC